MMNRQVQGGDGQPNKAQPTEYQVLTLVLGTVTGITGNTNQVLIRYYVAGSDPLTCRSDSPFANPMPCRPP